MRFGTMLRARARPVGWGERRERLDAIGQASPVDPDIKLTAVEAGGVPAEWSVAPGSDPTKVLMFLHGGGYCSGSITSHRGMVTRVGRAAGVRTLALNYRLAPEHPFPAALTDALAAYGFLLDQGIAPQKIAIGGDSAGGGAHARHHVASARRRQAAARLRLAGVALDGPRHDGREPH